ncbi:50S ribosomal protein L29 [Candidatus Micrarchaeota archaeon]|nr:50S ribosomal protein L29 [Candidatus Micrarchaeota archaeon]
MAILRMKEINAMDEETLNKKIEELKGELYVEKASIARGGKAINPGRIKELKRTIARILTVINLR